MIIAVTGKIGTGKSTLARKIIAEGFFTTPDGVVAFENAELCEADDIGHALLYDLDVKEAVIKEFGEGILVGGEISRKMLGDIVFSDKKAMDALTMIMHPRISARCSKYIADTRCAGRNMIVAVALPKSLGISSLCDHVIRIDLDKEVVWQRLRIRNPDMTRERFDTTWQWQDREYPQRS